MLRYWLSAADLVWSWCLVSCRYRNTIAVTDHEKPPGLHQLLGQDGAGLGLDPAVEVAGDVLRHRAVLAAQSLQTGLGALQRVGKLECSVGRGLTRRLRRNIVSFNLVKTFHPTVNGLSFSSVFLFFMQMAQHIKMMRKMTRAAAAAAMMMGMMSSPCTQIF